VRENAGFRLASSTPTLATMLRAKGFATGAFIGSFALDSRFGLNTGFDVYDERYGQSNVNSGFVMRERRGDVVVAAATDWIGRQKGKWFAWVHLFDPHAPYRPPAPFAEQYNDRRYYGEVAFTDFALAPLLEAARAATGRPTLVVVTGDHGEGLGDHGEMTHGLFAYEATLHVPLILAQLNRKTPAWPAEGPSKAGRVLDAPARHVDILPTILAALGQTAPAGLSGRSLLGRDPGDAVSSYFEALAASLNRGWAPLTGVLTGREKYISLPIPELYDLRSDPGEATNLADRDPARRRVLENRLGQFGPVQPQARQAVDAESRSRLQALGYVTGQAAQKDRYTEDDDPKRLVQLDSLMWKAIELCVENRQREAIPIYRQVISARPTMEVAYAQLAMLFWEIGEPEEAIATLRTALAAGVSSVQLTTKLGTYLAETGKVKEAVPLLQQATSANTEDVDALNALGIALGRSGRTTEAVSAFEQILRLAPSNAMALENLGSIALAGHRWDDARRYFDHALQLDAASAQAHNGLGVVEMEAGNRKAAIEHWEAAVARDPQNFDALYNVATELVNDNRPEAAGPYLERFIRTAPPAFYAPDIARARNMLARIRK
jgi:tetratricopeptide (TPR) repeat protein